jgi:hypothetical protein
MHIIFSNCFNFVRSRDILDNALTSFEVLRYMKCKTGGKDVRISSKLYVSKIINRIKWDYLQTLMKKRLLWYLNWLDYAMFVISKLSYVYQVGEFRIRSPTLHISCDVSINWTVLTKKKIFIIYKSIFFYVYDLISF